VTTPEPASDEDPIPLPPHTPTCMGCGPENPAGLRLQAYRSGEQVWADVVFDERQMGAPGLTHGGAVAAACDDLFGFTLWIVGTPAVTRSLTVEYLAPVPLHQPHRITAHITDRQGRAVHVSATGTANGVTRFTANAVFVTVSRKHFAQHGDSDSFAEMLGTDSANKERAPSAQGTSRDGGSHLSDT
jgi:acyl-coenzyme A thioesterase PaaI-like protein